MKSITLTKNDAGQRLDKFLQKSYKMPVSLMYKYIRKKRIRINGKHPKENVILNEGDVLELYINDELLTEKPLNIGRTGRLDIVYEDENIIIMDKPKGLLCHGEGDTLLDRMTSYLVRKGEYKPKEQLSFAPALCNRLDRNTAGLLIGAKNAQALRAVNEKIKSREIKKYYLCLCYGAPKDKQGILESYLEKDESINKVTILDTPTSDSKVIRTGYKVLKEKDGFSLMEIELFTGRSHQIRAQLQKIGCPIVGDKKYALSKNNKKAPFEGQALYSYKLTFDMTQVPEILADLQHKTFKAPRVYFKDFI